MMSPSVIQIKLADSFIEAAKSINLLAESTRKMVRAFGRLNAAIGRRHRLQAKRAAHYRQRAHGGRRIRPAR
jgi:hypothetical protein